MSERSDRAPERFGRRWRRPRRALASAWRRATADPRRDERAFARLLDDALSSDRGVATPPIADAVMARLGYERIASPDVRRAARRRRLLRRAAQTATWAIMLGAALVGLKLHNMLPSRMVPADLTVPDAVERQLEAGQRRLNGFIQAIGDLRVPVRADDGAADQRDDGASPGELRPPFGSDASDALPSSSAPAAAPFRIA